MNTTLALLFVTVSQTLDLPPGLLSSLCFVESSHRVGALHKNDGHGDSIGVCQIQYSAAYDMGFRGSLTLLAKPGVNVYYSGKYLRYQLSRYSGNVEYAVAAYNSGSVRLARTGTPTNKKYVQRVMTAWESGR